MTAARRQRKLHLFALGLALSAMATDPAALGAPILAASGQIVVDPNSGLAISGFDPVAYFTDAEALPGKGEFEQEVAGVIWRFRNAGNRAAFVADPGIYMPRFGGYDPIAIARGVAVAGNPRVWIVSDERLYLFYTPQAREEFAAAADAMRTAAERKWPSVNRKLVP